MAKTKAKRYPRPDTPLTDGQERFAREYVRCGNATTAYGIAYPQSNLKSRGQLASRMLKNAKVSTFVRGLQAEIAKANAIDADRVMKEWAEIGFANIAEFIPVGANGRRRLDLDSLADDRFRAVAEYTEDAVGETIIRRRVKLHPKTAALDSIAKAIGMLTDRFKLDLSDLRGMSDAQLLEAAKQVGLA